MTTSARGPVVADTNVFSARLRSHGQRTTALHEPVLTGRKAFISFQTVMELEYGARVAHWGAPRLARLAALIQDAETVWPGPELASQRAAGVRRRHLRRRPRPRHRERLISPAQLQWTVAAGGSLSDPLRRAGLQGRELRNGADDLDGLTVDGDLPTQEVDPVDGQPPCLSWRRPVPTDSSTRGRSRGEMTSETRVRRRRAAERRGVAGPLVA